ncbi:hypothetical protein [Motiliproteus sediminis]|uniref:hypothetical protein n=1 Tax=Motiliproteus sediminis TaxID=1468178 RepID=UPI001AEFCC2B|nr:hypothetical protein [Motiliproteus sediminis]
MADQQSNAGESLAEILQDWDGEELMEGVQIAAKALGVKSLHEWLELTTQVEEYQHHLHPGTED